MMTTFKYLLTDQSEISTPENLLAGFQKFTDTQMTKINMVTTVHLSYELN